MSDKNEKILIIKLSALGDFVQAIGLMRAIRNHHSKAHITLMTSAAFENLAKESNLFDSIWMHKRPKWNQPGKWLNLRKKLITEHFRRVFDLQNSDRTALYFHLIPHRYKPEWVGAVKGASHYYNAPDRTEGHAFQGHIKTLAKSGVENIEIDDLRWLTGNIDKFNLPEDYALLVPGCAPSRPEKQWPAESFGLIAQHLFSNGLTPVILGTHHEKEMAQIINKLCPAAVNLTEKTKIRDIVLLARNAKFAVGNDTGPMHLIAPTGCSSLVLFSGYSDPVKHKPLGKNVHVIRENELVDLKPETVIATLNAITE